MYKVAVCVCITSVFVAVRNLVHFRKLLGIRAFERRRIGVILF